MCITPESELLRQCIASGQVSASQAVQHAEAGELMDKVDIEGLKRYGLRCGYGGMPLMEEEGGGAWVRYSDHLAVVEGLRRQVEEYRAAHIEAVNFNAKRSAELGKALGQRPTADENPGFKCGQCGSNDIWYTTGETSDGAYDTYSYHCHGCGRQWRIVDECD